MTEKGESSSTPQTGSQYYSFLENLRVPACILDGMGNFIYSNAMFIGFLGKIDDEIKLDETHPYFREYRSNMTLAFNSAMKGLEGKSFAVLRSKKVPSQAVEIYYYPLFHHDSVTSVLAFLRPVENRLLSYDQNTRSLINSTKTCYESTMFEYSPMGIFRVGRDTAIIRCSNSFETITGYSEDNSDACSSLFIYDFDRFRKIVADIHDGIIPFHRMGEIKILTAKNSTGVVNLILYPVIIEGIIDSVEILMENITRVKELENKISGMNKIEMLSDITLGFLHGLNNTMNVIMSQSQLLLQLTEKQSLIERISIIENSATSIIEQLGRYQHFIADTQDSEKTGSKPLIDLLEDSIEFSKMQFKASDRNRKKDVTIEKTYFTNPNVTVAPRSFKELIVAVILKVAAFIDKSGTVSVTLKDQKDIVIGITVEKIYLETAAFLNEDLQGVTSHMNIRHLAESVGAKVFEEESQTAYSVKVILPGRLVSYEEKEKPGPPVYKIRNHAILIVEDEPALQKILYELFDSMGNRVTVSDNGKKALEIYRSAKFDLVLTDYDIAEMTGVELAARIREIDEKTITVLLSGWMLNDIESYRNIIDLFVSKPFKLDDLIQKVAQVFQKKGAPALSK